MIAATHPANQSTFINHSWFGKNSKVARLVIAITEPTIKLVKVAIEL